MKTYSHRHTGATAFHYISNGIPCRIIPKDGATITLNNGKDEYISIFVGVAGGRTPYEPTGPGFIPSPTPIINALHHFLVEVEQDLILIPKTYTASSNEKAWKAAVNDNCHLVFNPYEKKCVGLKLGKKPVRETNFGSYEYAYSLDPCEFSCSIIPSSIYAHSKVFIGLGNIDYTTVKFHSWNVDGKLPANMVKTAIHEIQGHPLEKAISYAYEMREDYTNANSYQNHAKTAERELITYFRKMGHQFPVVVEKCIPATEIAAIVETIRSSKSTSCTPDQR